MKTNGPSAQTPLLDRLLDDAPTNTEEAPMTQSQSMRQYRAAVRRDLEWLLNTRCAIPELGDDYEELSSSLYTYGLPDFGSYGAGSSQTRQKLLRSIRHAIMSNEPRIMSVEVSAIDNESDDRRGELHFQISGLLRVDPLPEQVTFDTRIEIGKGEYKVREA